MIGPLTLAWVPFVDPLPVYEGWWLLLVPMAAAVAVVNKAVKCYEPGEIPRAAAVNMFWLLAGFVGGAAAVELIYLILA